MPASGCFADIMARLQQGDAAAAAEVFGRFTARLMGLARSRLGRRLRRKVDPEDVLQSVYKSIFLRQARPPFDLNDWDGLWGLLAVITIRKCGQWVDRFHAGCRDIDREASSAVAAGRGPLPRDVLARDPTAAEVAVLAETVEQLLHGLEGRDRDIVALGLQGYSAAEISASLGRPERTVYRILERVKKELHRIRDDDVDCQAAMLDPQQRASQRAWERLERVLESFEDAWNQGQRPKLEDYLTGVGPVERLPLLLELIHEDLEFRIKAGAAAAIDDYLARFPELAGAPAVVEELRGLEAKLRGVSVTEVGGAPGQSGPMESGETAVLEVLEGPHRDARFLFTRHQTFLVGRVKTAHLSLPDDRYFSRHHFLLEFNPPRCLLRDLGSRNGTLVNGAKVQEAFLKDGDIIGGGRTRIRFSVSLPTAPALEIDSGPAFLADQPPVVPGHELLRPLGRGGMGMVHLARKSASGELVAVKLILPDAAASAQAVQFFLREVSILSQLAHPRIVRFREVGIAGKHFFLVMDYVEAEDLHAMLAPRSARNRMKTACGIMCQALDALSHAHAKGFVHRDIKPGNLLVSRAGRKLRVKLADFGLAKSFQAGGLSGMTFQGDVRGSLPYIAPEQLLDCGSAQPAADLYSAGATLYRLLAGHAPYEFPKKRDPFAVILEDDFVPLSQRCPDLPNGLIDLVHRSLARKPEERFASAAEMRRLLVPFARAREAGE